MQQYDKVKPALLVRRQQQGQREAEEVGEEEQQAKGVLEEEQQQLAPSSNWRIHRLRHMFRRRPPSLAGTGLLLLLKGSWGGRGWLLPGGRAQLGGSTYSHYTVACLMTKEGLLLRRNHPQKVLLRVAQGFLPQAEQCSGLWSETTLQYAVEPCCCHCQPPHCSCWASASAAAQLQATCHCMVLPLATPPSVQLSQVRQPVSQLLLAAHPNASSV